MTEAKSAELVRPESCKANLDTEYPTCDRCGLAWRRADAPPECKPMTFDALRLVMLGEIAAHEGSHHAIAQMMRDHDMPADPVVPLRRAAALRFALALLERCVASKVIVAELGRIAREAKRAAQPDEADHE